MLKGNEPLFFSCLASGRTRRSLCYDSGQNKGWLDCLGKEGSFAILFFLVIGLALFQSSSAKIYWSMCFQFFYIPLVAVVLTSNSIGIFPFGSEDEMSCVNFKRGLDLFFYPCKIFCTFDLKMWLSTRSNSSSLLLKIELLKSLSFFACKSCYQSFV